MAALCIDGSLETLRPLSYRSTHRFQGGVSAAAFTGYLFRLVRL